MTMIVHSIKNSESLCENLNTLLNNDIAYIIDQSKFIWGNHSDNLMKKFMQYEEINSLPVFNELLLNGLHPISIYLYYVKPGFCKTFFNSNSVTNEINNTVILIPLYVPNLEFGIPAYASYKEDKLIAYNTVADLDSVANAFRVLGRDLSESYHVIRKDTPVIISDPKLWVGMSNVRSNDHLVFLHMTLTGNPTFDQVIKCFNH